MMSFYYLSPGVEPAPGTPLEAKGKRRRRGERRKKKWEEKEGAPLGDGAGSATAHPMQFRSRWNLIARNCEKYN